MVNVMELIGEYTYEIKKSKFIAYAYDLSSPEEANNVYETLKKEHKKANHIVYAYIIDQYAKKYDDKEPSNTAGMPIYDILLKQKLNHIGVFVVRYFGGIKLGAGGLMRAYRTAAVGALKK